MPLKGYKHTDEAKEKIRQSKKGKKRGPMSEEWKQKLSRSLKGKPKPPGHGRNVSRALRGIKRTEEQIRNNSIAQKGKNLSEETKQKLSEANRGSNNPMHGKKHSEDSKKRMSDARMGKLLGSDNHKWKGGASFEIYPVDWTETLKRSIRERDRYTCQLCGELQGNRAHCVHHIDYNKKNCDPNNLITLCRGCNSKVNSNREYWAEYFRNI